MVMVKWYPSKKKYYLDKNYSPYKHYEYFECYVGDLTKNSMVEIEIICDYCFGIFKRSYSNYLKYREKDTVKKDCCLKKECRTKKHKESNVINYGSEHPNFVSGEGSRVNKNNATIRNTKIIENYFSQNKHLIQISQYINITTKIKYLCMFHYSNGIQEISVGSLKRGSGCRYCGLNKISKSRKKYDEVYVRNYLLDEGLIYIDGTYTLSNNKLKFCCTNHPDIIQEKSFSEIIKGRCCRLCSIEHHRGENHNSWKGGITPLQNYMRDRIKLWKDDSLRKYGYTCALSNDKKGIVIHHLYNFANILRETLYELKLESHEQISNYSSEELNRIENLMIEKHYQYGLGIPLRADLHDLFHSLYGKRNNTPEQFEEFKDRYLLGEFYEAI